MKMPAFFSAKYQSCIRSFMSARNAVRRQVFGRVEYNRRYFPAGANGKEKISFENLCDILNYDPDEAIQEALRLKREFEKKQHENSEKSPKEKEVRRVISEREHLYIPERAYIKHITEKSREYGIEEHILIEELREGMSMSIDKSRVSYRVKYEITIKNLIIKLGLSNIPPRLKFDESKEKDYSKPEFLYKGGIYFRFESNSFVLPSPDTINRFMPWSLGQKRYLDFEKNKFESIEMEIATRGKSIVNFTDNYLNCPQSQSPHRGIFIHGESIAVRGIGNYFNIPLIIRGILGGKGGWQTIDNYYEYPSYKMELARRMEKQINESRFMPGNQHIKDIKNKIKEGKSLVNIKDILKMLLYMDEKIIVKPDDLKHGGKSIVQLNDNNFSELTIDAHECHFTGKNIINNLSIKNIGYLYWGGYQKIAPEGENAREHKKRFMELIERAVQNNDKILEARLRRELMKCERALLREEKIWHSLQDRFILGWSSLVSDYGISWFRPFLWLLAINALFATIVYFSPSQDPSWLPLFVKFFNPLNNLSTATGITDNTWISFIAILQKALFALFLYEMIKIFRRFSK